MISIVQKMLVLVPFFKVIYHYFHFLVQSRLHNNQKDPTQKIDYKPSTYH